MNNEPVAIVKLGGDVELLTDVLPYNAKLYTHPAKTLTEDILWELAEKYIDTDDSWGESNVTGIGDFIEAILRKAQENG